MLPYGGIKKNLSMKKQNPEKEVFFTVVVLLCEMCGPNDPLFCLVRIDEDNQLH